MKTLPARGYLLHITHYDPKWCPNKDTEVPFDLDVGLELIDVMAEVGLNVLVVDCADGLTFPSHPELAKHYTAPISHLETLVQAADARNIELIPKLNFSQSPFHRHNDWMAPYNGFDDTRDYFDSDEYWQIAFELIDDIIDAARPARFFHIGMDEDDARAHSLFADAVITLHGHLKRRGLRTLMWRDSRTDPRGRVFSEKHQAAGERIPKDIVQTVWKYLDVVPPEVIRGTIEQGFEVWGGCGGNGTTDITSRWRRILQDVGATGMVLTKWIPCNRRTREELIHFLQTHGPLCNA